MGVAKWIVTQMLMFMIQMLKHYNIADYQLHMIPVVQNIAT